MRNSRNGWTLHPGVYKTFSIVTAVGRGRVLTALADPDTATLILDSTVVRAHPHAAGARKKNGPQSLVRSRSGFGTKVHASDRGRGHPRVLKLTPGQAADAPHAGDHRLGSAE